MGKLAEMCWDGLTLKHISHKRIVNSYLLFLIMASIVEMFLAIVYGASFYFFNQFSYEPGISYYLCGPILLLLMFITLVLLKTVTGRKKGFSLH